MTVTSCVPPPKLKTRTFISLSALSRPYARQAAVGSLIILTTSRPAISPGVLGGLPLVVVEVSRDGDDGLLDGVAEEGLGVLLDLL